MQYIAKIYKEDESFLVEFPDIPGCLTYGNSLEEAMEMAKDALNGILSVRLKEKEPLPVSKTKANAKKGFYAIEVECNLAVAYTVFEARRGKSAAGLCRKMGISRQAFCNFENPHKSVSIPSLEKLAKALGKRLEISFV